MGTVPWWRYVVSGVLATLTMDLGAAVLRLLRVSAGVPPRFIGRWFAHLARGRLVHRTIADAPDLPGQLPLTVACHYLIGITLTVLFAVLLRHGPFRIESRGGVMAAAVAFGTFTNVLPWLLMFPAMGFGWCGSQGPPEYLLLRSSFLNHVAFGIGLALVAATGLLPLSPRE